MFIAPCSNSETRGALTPDPPRPRGRSGTARAGLGIRGDRAAPLALFFTASGLGESSREHVGSHATTASALSLGRPQLPPQMLHERPSPLTSHVRATSGGSSGPGGVLA